MTQKAGRILDASLISPKRTLSEYLLDTLTLLQNKWYGKLCTLQLQLQVDAEYSNFTS